MHAGMTEAIQLIGEKADRMVDQNKRKGKGLSAKP